ncbi:structure-specific endonuclease subunit SLX1 [Anticarsia gemmatalis]|uniref:structure-specific endonuclease subunit SLX1 n=1 Tax=Anticarsia gemmatalis TaxID=129554 RepID=UPI003F773648
MSEVEVVEDFFGVYLLYCLNPKYKGRTYIGYTRDPNRRIMQHNRGTWAGGAYRTNNKGPWKMVMIVHGFPNNISALRFEWAWQNPTTTVRLKHLNLKKIPRKETEFKFKLRVLCEMLRVGPWCRLPLVIRWLEEQYREEFPIERAPPGHMTIVQGAVKSKNLKPSTSLSTNEECLLCSNYITDGQAKLTCLNSNCQLISHITCLADIFLTSGEYVPIEGTCPFCNTKIKWGDLIRKMRGCFQGAEECVSDESSEEVDKEFVDHPSWFLDCDDDL